jgi:hypothetical protein
MNNLKKSIIQNKKNMNKNKSTFHSIQRNRSKDKHFFEGISIICIEKNELKEDKQLIS